jgi:RNA polymerase sigma-70 factor (ECF subfamily)
VINPADRGHGASVSSGIEQHGTEPAPKTPPPQSPTPPAPDASPLDFAALVRANLDFVWRQLRRLGVEPADADDATQQVFLVASRRQGELTPGKERSFFYGTAVRVAANARRGRGRQNEVPEALAREPVEGGPWPDEIVEQRRARALLDLLLGKLPDELRRVLVLAEVEQLTVVAIAELEGIPAGTAASRLRRARAAFRELLEQHAAEHPNERRRS